MRAVWMQETGGPEVLVAGDARDPEAADGQVVVDVSYVNITFVETQLRAGRGPFPLEPPVIPGNGVGGIVRSVGAGVDEGLVGTRVVTSTGGSGAYAEQVAVDAALLLPVPPSLALDDAVAVLADGRTAMMLAAAAGLTAGQRVLVEAAAGGVGSLLVQLAARAGATVVAAAGGGRKVDVARRLGATVAVDYRRTGWTREVRDSVGQVDVVFDGVGGDIARDAFGLLGPGGRMVIYGLASGTWAPIHEDEAAAAGVALVRPVASPEELRIFTHDALTGAAKGWIRPLIGQRFDLSDAAAAHAAIEGRSTIGKTLLEVDAPQRSAEVRADSWKFR